MGEADSDRRHIPGGAGKTAAVPDRATAGHPRTALAVLLTSGLVIALVIGLGSGCAARTAPAGPGARHGSPTATAAPATAPGGFNATDVAWLQLMIPMDERVLPLLDLGAGRGHDPAVRRLAARFRHAHLAELARLREALGRTGLPPSGEHEGHDMPGMVTAAGLAELKAATGPAFDRLFAGHLREHLDRSAAVARSEQAAGADPATRALAAAVERSRTTQRALLDALRLG
ncbi:uncharacterized protein (DUF305 family) [Thermocatellispora tengchongensis]|uniref:Uncharacterized protein (DUF305 family) n=1 Tax=Thermocatellispora tengchongensis TaxID=1073253 RepID=A0A840PE81_9ACTN|nr:DUF305 domain-containing protein [Thermocatellispora tengchongensis]MBB5137918.1 uncharacterized protein (DUF305 family) [Thermocatellispora tengchongensis]